MKKILLSLFFVLMFTSGLVAQTLPTKRPCVESNLTWRVTKHASSEFDGATENAHGSLGEKPTYTVFTVSGDVLVRGIWGVINTTITDAGDACDLSLGVTGNTTAFFAAEAAGGASAGDTFADGEVWAADGVAPVAGAEAEPGVQNIFMINDGADVIETTTGADCTAGQMDYYIIWAPAESGAVVTSDGTLS